MNGKNTNTQLFYALNKSLLPFMAVLFLLVNILLQVQFFNDFFLNPNSNGDENYQDVVDGIAAFSWSQFSEIAAQPYLFVCYWLNRIFEDAQFTTRFTSLLACTASFLFVFLYYRKNKFTDVAGPGNRWNIFAIFSTLFGVFFIASTHFIGTSDGFSAAFAIPAFLLLTEVLLNKKKHSVVLIGFLLALSFTSRPTVVILLLGFLLSLLFFFPKELLAKKLFFSAGYAIAFTALINCVPLVKSAKIVLDVKEIPKEVGVSWFDMNYLMAKKWDAGEIPRTQWLTPDDVLRFKKENPNFDYPKNHLDILINEPGLFIRQMLHMGVISMYSSFRYLYFLFPFLIFYRFVKEKKAQRSDTRQAYFTVCFYFTCLLLFMASAFKLMEFRWMFLVLVFYAFHALDFTKNIDQAKRFVLFNSIFAMGIVFFIFKMLR